MRFTRGHCSSHDRRRLWAIRAVSVKAAALAAITQDAFVPLWRSLVSDRVVLLMLHRFADRERNIRGDSPDLLRANLEFLRRHRFRIASLNDLLDPRSEGAGDGPTVVFTVDDGYADFAQIAAPIFAEFDCPVTVFLVTDTIDRQLWFWWDRIEFILESSHRSVVTLELSAGGISRPRLDGGRVDATLRAFSEALKAVPDDEKEAAIVRLATDLEVVVPPAPPARFAAMTWRAVEKCAAAGVTFGPHTLRHPMLTQVDPDRAASEIIESWTRLKEKCSSTTPMFCYPNGSFTKTHTEILARSDLRAAITTDPGYATASMFASPDPLVRYGIPRFTYPGDRTRFVQIVAGVERIKTGVRDAFRGFGPTQGGQRPSAR